MQAEVKSVKSVLGGVIGLVMLGTPAFSAVVNLNIPGSETTVFSEDFNDNSKGWAATGGQSLGSFGATQAGETVWKPTVAGDGANHAMALTLPAAVNIADGPISIYYRVLTPGVNTSNNRFSTLLSGDGGNNGNFGFQFANNQGGGGSNTRYLYRNGAGAQDVTTVQLVPTNNYVNYRLTLSKNIDGSFNLVAAIDKTNSGTYTVYGAATADTVTNLTGAGVLVGTGGVPGRFAVLNLSQRNAGSPDALVPTNANYFDAIAVTQNVPEPAAGLAVLGLGSVLGLARRRR